MGWRKELDREVAGYGLKVAFIAGKGRGLITTRDFSPGEVLFWQEPYVAVPDCSQCKNASNCTKSFQRDDSKLRRVERCVISRFSAGQIIPPRFRIAMKLLLKAQLQQDEEIPTSGIDNYKLVEALKSNIDHKRLAIFAHVAKRIKFLIPYLDFDLYEMIQIIAKLSLNARNINEANVGYIGIGLYPVISLINKSDDENSIIEFVGPVAFVRAIEYIPANSEVILRSDDPSATTMEPKASFFLQNLYNKEAMTEGYRGIDENEIWMDEEDEAGI